MTCLLNLFKPTHALALLFILFSINLFAVDHPSSGTTTGTVICGTTYNYYDPGGVGGNYGNGQLGILELNPSVGGQYVSIDFTIGAFDVEPNGGGCWDFIQIFDGPNTGAPLIGTYCNSNVPGVITSTTGSLTVLFDSDGFTTRSGWVAEITCSVTPGPPPPLVHPSSGTTTTSVICGNTIDYFDPGGAGGNYGSNQLGILELNPSVGGQYVSIDFTIGAFDVEPNGGGCFDFIQIFDGPNTGAPLIGTYCNSNVPGVITSTTGSLTVLFDSDGFTTRSGWVAEITCSATPGPPPPLIHPSSGTTTTSVICGNTIDYFDPGGAGGNYGSNQLGILELNPSVGGQYVSIDFTIGAFDVEPNGGGCFDFIQIFDGPNTGAPLIGTYCNSNLPGIITSSTGSLTVLFDSDGFTSLSGWVAEITCSATPGPPPPITHPNSGTSSTTVDCGVTSNYYDPGGSGGNYTSALTGTLTLNPSVGGSMVRINFTTGPFDIEGCGGAACTCDWIRIYDGVNTGAPLIGQYCNGNVPGIITSTTGSLTVEFFRDALTVGTGWDAEVTCFTPCPIASGTAAAAPNALCPAASGNTTLSLAGEDPAATIQWQVSTDGGTTWSNIAGATTDPWVQFLSVNSMYQALVTNGCTSISNAIAVTVNCPDIIQPSTGFTTANVGCGGSTSFYDTGGSGANYSNNENGLITICPSIPGQYVQLTVVQFDTQNNIDELYIFDGDDASADIIGIYSGFVAAGPTITASSANPSGCLSFRFTSSGVTNFVGWNFTMTCTGTPAAPYATGVEDCTGGVVVCGDGALNGGTTGFGYQELPSAWNSCLNFGGDAEIQSNWYIFSPATSGIIGFLISPSPAADYDWTVWGPYPSLQCPAFTNDPPLRCSAASLATSGPSGETGLAAPAVDVIEASGGDGYLMPLTVVAGEIYVMMLDNWDGNSNPFTLSWQLSNGATLDCTPPILPVKLLDFTAECDRNETVLQWSTALEINNNFFIVEKSGPDFDFKEIGKVYGAGNSSIQNDYSFVDTENNDETAYYRLIQVDYNGTIEYHKIIASNCYDNSFEVVKSILTNSDLNLSITTSTNEILTISLYSSVGKLITQQKREINSGTNSISLTNFNISSGIYLISIKGEFNVYSQKLISK